VLISGETRRSSAAGQPLSRRHLTMGGQVSLAAVCAAALLLAPPALAKTPGEVHCYNGICHRVKTVDEMALLVGRESEAITSFYDTAERDKMNAGTVTSSGEKFDAASDSTAASSLYPDGTELLIWHPKNRHAAHIRVNDFGPFYMLRTIDVTRRVAELLDFYKSGVTRLRVAIVWAPSPEAARYRRRRSYPAVEGYVGRLDYDQFVALKHRLIDTGQARNPAPVMIAASFHALPAFAGAHATPAARIKTAALNTPISILKSRQPTATVKTLGPAKAIAVSNRAPPLVVAARDARVVDLDAPEEITVAVATLPVASAVVDVPIEAEPRAPSFEPSGGATWLPNTLLWQQLLAGLVFLTIATLAWRTRSSSKRIAPAAAGRHSPVSAVPEAVTGDGAAVADRFDEPPVIAHVVAEPSMEALRDDAIAHMEAYAFSAAEAAYRRLLATREKVLGPGDPMTGNAERQLASCLRDQGRYNAAEPHYRRALATMSLAIGDQHPATADVLDDYGVCLLRQGRGPEAERMARQSLSIRRSNGIATREYAGTLSIVAETLRVQGQLGAAEAEHRTALAQFVALSGPDGLDAAASMTSIGTVLGEMGRFGPGEDLLNAGTRILSSVCGHDHPISATGYALLGDLYRRAGALDPARTMLSHALSIRESKLGDRHPDTIETLLSLALIATEQYRLGDARGLLDRALDSLIAGERHALGPQSRVRALLVALSHHHDVSEPQRAAAE